MQNCQPGALSKKAWTHQTAAQSVSTTCTRMHFCKSTSKGRHMSVVYVNQVNWGWMMPLTLSFTRPTSMGCAVSIVHSCRASHGSSGRPILVAKSLAVPIGITAMDRDSGACNLTRALATCTVYCCDSSCFGSPEFCDLRSFQLHAWLAWQESAQAACGLPRWMQSVAILLSKKTGNAMSFFLPAVSTSLTVPSPPAATIASTVPEAMASATYLSVSNCSHVTRTSTWWPSSLQSYTNEADLLSNWSDKSG